MLNDFSKWCTIQFLSSRVERYGAEGEGAVVKSKREKVEEKKRKGYGDRKIVTES